MIAEHHPRGARIADLKRKVEEYLNEMMIEPVRAA